MYTKQKCFSNLLKQLNINLFYLYSFKRIVLFKIGGVKMFCQNCNKEIPDGALFCTSCGANQVPQQPIQQPVQQPIPPVQQQSYQPQQTTYTGNPQPNGTNVPMNTKPPKAQKPATPNKFVMYLKDIFTLMMSMLKKPVTASKEFIRAEKTPVSFMLIGIQSITIVFVILAFFLSIFIKNNDFFEYIEIPVFSITFMALFVSFGASCLFPVALTMFFSVFKIKTDYKKMLSVIATASIPSTICIIVCIPVVFILGLINLGIATTLVPAIIFSGAIMSILLISQTVDAAAPIEDDKKIYAVLFSIISVVFVAIIFLRVISPSILEDAFRTSMFY